MQEDKDWTIEQVSQEPAREWNNPKGGIIYYKKVKLAGHPKAVSVGKKTPDALQPGGTIFGHIQADMSGPEDKFKAGQKQGAFGGGYSGGGASNPKPAYQPRDDDAIRAQWAIGQAMGHVNTLGLKYITDRGIDEVVHNSVLKLATDLFAMVNHVKSGSPIETPTAPTGNPARLKPGQPVWPSDKPGSDPEWESMFTAGAQADDINLDEIPF